MASTGVYWLPLYDRLEHAGFQGLRGAPRQVPRAPKRPQTAVHACQGSQRLHRLGLLPAACRPEEPIRVWRASQRPRSPRIAEAGRHLQRRDKALAPLHVKLPEVVSDRTGLTGRRILRALVQGARAPQGLARWRDRRCQASAEPSARALQGTWQPEPLCARQPSWERYDSSAG
jgi:hypothetical protein